MKLFLLKYKMFNFQSISNLIEFVNYFKDRIKALNMECQILDFKNNNLEKFYHTN